jgi:gliding motility-associated-like protein
VTFDAGNAGADYLWSTGDNTQTIQKGNGDAGDYWVIVTESGCSDTDSVNLTVATELIVDLGDDFEICTGTTTVLDAGFGTGYTFDWNEGGAQNDQTFTTGQGEVRVEVRDPGGCYGRDTVVVTEVNPLVISLGADDSICSGDAALTFSMESGRTDVSVVGWQDGSTDYTLTSSNAGWYWLEVDSAGCVYRDSLELTIHALPVVDLGTDTFICVGTTPTISLTGGTFTTYQWADITNSVPNMLGDSETQDISSIGTYGLVVTDANGCVNGDTIQVTEEQGTAIGFTLDTTICPAGSATITVPSTLQQVTNGSWTWFNDGSSGSSYTVSNESDGSIVHVILDFTNPSGCVTRDTAIVRIDNNLPISLRDTAICEGEDVTFSSGYPALGYTYTWQDNSTNNTFAITGAQASDAGEVSVSMESDEGCTGNASVQLTVNALPDPQLSAAPICLGDDRILDHGLPGVQSAWDHGETTNPITVTTAGTYRVTVTDGNNCEDTVSVVLVVNNPPSFTLPSDQTLCLGEEYALGTGMDEVTHTHQWFGGSSATTADIAVTASGEYRVNVTEVATTCVSSDTVSFVFLDVPTVDLGLDTNLCEGDVATLSSPGTDASYAFTWSTTGSSNSIQVISTGEYWLEAANGGCVDRDTISVVFFENPVSELMDDVILCFDDLEEALSLDPGRNGEEYLWSTGETSQVINVDERGTYIVNITNLAGCVTQDYVEIKEDCPAHVWLPNSFTADGNSLNDVWMIQGRSIESVEVYVFNRWGELVWEGNALGQFWDGTHNVTQQPVQQDIYVYHLKYTYFNVNGYLESKQRVGRIALIR